MLAKTTLYGHRLNLVVDLGAGAVGIYVTNVFWIQFSIPKGHPNTTNGSTALRMNVGDPVCISR